jgi:hypothetical protein
MPVLGRRVDAFVLLLQAHGVPLPVSEYRFAPPRRWRADYAWPAERVIVERDGGLLRGGRHPSTAVGGHSSISGIRRDMEKSNAAQLAGYVYLRFTPQQLASGVALPSIRAALTLQSLRGSQEVTV